MLDGEVFEEYAEGGKGSRFILVEDGSIIDKRADELGSVDFRVVVAKEGYTTLVRQLTVTGSRCGFGSVEGDREFRLVEGPPGENDIFRKARRPEGATMHTTLNPAPITDHTATLLQDGKVLVTGGRKAPNAVEVYDPATNTWTARPGLLTGRHGHGAISLVDGRVLIAGGRDNLASAELIGTSGNRLGPAGEMDGVYNNSTLFLLEDGRVLVVGDGTRSTEVYDPRKNQWSHTGNMVATRLHHTVTLLPDGGVLATGGTIAGRFSGYLDPSAELFEPALGSWSLTGSLHEPRHGHSATLLGDGRVLVVGGQAFSGKLLASSEIYDPATAAWAPAASANHVRNNHTATLLLDGRVLVAGGGTTEAEIFDPFTGIWSPAAQMKRARRNHTATRLADGRVLVVGGTRGDGMYAYPEIYDPVKDSWD